MKKASERFGWERVTFVGDRGMIQSGQIEDLAQTGFHYITAITKPQIHTLIEARLIQMELFTAEVCEVQQDGVRYVLRRIPIRAAQLAASRADKQTYVEQLRQDRSWRFPGGCTGRSQRSAWHGFGRHTCRIAGSAGNRCAPLLH